jgi:hypothetical protein
VRRILHLLRRAHPAPLQPAGAAIAPAEHWMVEFRAGVPHLMPGGAPPLSPGDLTFDDLHQLIRAADLVVTW